ncbi:MAG: hypothetical protein K2J20_04025 [Bacilli bacterium]|nr:hypothetical protein [Bacilli bacterium]
MQITIAHLFPYELNLYGENGNIKALKYALEKKNITVNIVNINPEDKLDFNTYDFVYLGSGRKKYLDMARNILKPYKEDILKYINRDKVMLATGNAIAIFDFLNLYEIEEREERIVADVTATCSLCKDTIKGFQNTEYLIKSTSSIIFNMNSGYGNDSTLMEGFMKNNFYATSIIGPILARNDKLTVYFVDTIENNK